MQYVIISIVLLSRRKNKQKNTGYKCKLVIPMGGLYGKSEWKKGTISNPFTAN
jgi:hypothetical protein